MGKRIMAEEKLDKLAITTKTKDSYAVVNTKGEVVETFRAKATAISWMWKLKKDFRDELKIIDMPNNEND